MNTSLVSIIIPVKDAQATIEKCISSLLNINYNNYEIIVIDDNSQDNTAFLLKKYPPRIKIITNSSSIGPSESRNIGVRQSRGDYLFFTDADCIIDKNCINELLEGLKKFPDAVSCGGRQDIPEDASNFQKGAFLFMKKVGFVTDYMRHIHIKDKVIEVAHNASCCVIYEKEFFLKAGGFRKGLWPGEDVEIDYRLKKKGCKLVSNPRALVYHYRTDNLKKFCQMMYRYGYVQGLLVRKYGIFRKIQFVPAITAIFVILILFSFFKNSLLTIIILVMFLFAVWSYLKFNFGVLFFSTLICWNVGYLKGLILAK